MARLVANVDITTETFGAWITKTNALLDALSNEIITANSTVVESTGNTTTPRFAQLIGAFTSNTIIATGALRGGNNTSSANLNITSNAIVSNVTFSSAANSLYTNTQFFTANVQSNGALFAVYGTTVNVTSNVTITAANQQFNTNSTVTAISIVGNSTATNTTIGGSALNIAANIAVTGVNHTVGGNVNFDAGTLFVDGVNNRIGLSNTTPDATLAVTGTANVSGAVRLASTLAVIGAATLSNTIAVTGAATLSNTLAVTGNVALNSTGLHTIAGNVNFDTGTLFVDSVNNRIGVNNTTPDAAVTITGAANVSGNYRVGGLTTLAGNATLSGTLQTISGNVNIDTGLLFVDSVNNRVGIMNTTPDASLTITGTANVSANVRVGGTLTLAGDGHTIAGNVNFDTGTVFVDSVNNRLGLLTTTPDATLGINGTANVSGATRLGSTLTVVGATTLSNTLAAGNTTITGFINTTSSANIGGNLNVVGTTSLANTLAIKTDYVVDVATVANIGNNSTARVIYTFPKASYRSGKLMVFANNNSGTANVNQLSEMVVAHDGVSTAYVTVYGTVASPYDVANTTSPLGTFNAKINTISNSVEILMNQVYSNSAVKVVAHLIV